MGLWALEDKGVDPGGAVGTARGCGGAAFPGQGSRMGGTVRVPPESGPEDLD